MLAGSLTPRQQEHLVHLATWMPFARAAQMLERLLGVQVSEPTARRQTEQVGALLEQEQTAASQTCPQRQARASQRVSQAARLVLSADGAFVPLVHGDWAEVRTLAIGEVEGAPPSSQEEVRTHAWSYFSRLTDAATFAEVAQVETSRRGVSEAEQVGAVTDGAE